VPYSKIVGKALDSLLDSRKLNKLFQMPLKITTILNPNYFYHGLAIKQSNLDIFCPNARKGKSGGMKCVIDSIILIDF
jgi:hypothetical protein